MPGQSLSLESLNDMTSQILKAEIDQDNNGVFAGTTIDKSSIKAKTESGGGNTGIYICL